MPTQHHRHFRRWTKTSSQNQPTIDGSLKSLQRAISKTSQERFVHNKSHVSLCNGVYFANCDVTTPRCHHTKDTLGFSELQELCSLLRLLTLTVYLSNFGLILPICATVNGNNSCSCTKFSVWLSIHEFIEKQWKQSIFKVLCKIIITIKQLQVKMFVQSIVIFMLRFCVIKTKIFLKPQHKHEQ